MSDLKTLLIIFVITVVLVELVRIADYFIVKLVQKVQYNRQQKKIEKFFEENPQSYEDLKKVVIGMGEALKNNGKEDDD